MPLIEGLGDEVTVVLGFAVIAILLVLAWVSTNVSEYATVNVIIVDRHGFQRLLQRLGFPSRNNGANNVEGTNSQPADTVQPTPQEQDSSVSSPPEGASVVHPEADTGLSVTQPSQQEPHSTSPLLPDLPNQPEQPPSSELTGVPTTQSNAEPLAPTSETATQPSTQAPDQEASTNTDTTESQATHTQETLTPDQLRQSRLAFFERIKNINATSAPTLSSAEAEIRNDSPEHQNADETVQSQSNTNNQNSAESPDVPRPANSNSSNEERMDGHIRIRLKDLNDVQRWVQARPEDTIGDFKRQHFGRELAQDLLVRCIFNGQELRPDSSTLQSYNIRDQAIIHCLSQARPQQEAPGVVEHEEWDIGTLTFPLFGLILLLVWYARFTYRAYFNPMSTFTLIGVTLMYVMAILATWRTHDAAHPHVHAD